MANRGMSSIKGAVKESQSQGGFMRYFRLGDGESTEVILLGTPATEPYQLKKHSFRDGKMFKTIAHREENCVACYANTNGDRRVNRPGIKLGFTFYDLAWMRKKKDEERSTKEGRDRFQFKRVDADAVTPKGVRKGIYVRAGKCGWEMPPQWATALDAVNNANRKRCRSCMKGKITLVSYWSVKKKKKVSLGDKEPDEVQELINSGKVTEKLECSKCKKPERMTIFNSIVTITRSGQNTNTSYQFGLSPDDYPEDFVELMDSKEPPEAYDWESLTAEPSTSQQAQELGIRDPFGSKRRRGEDDDDEADDYSNGDDDEEDERSIFSDDEDGDDEDGDADDDDDDEDPLSDEDDDDEDDDDEDDEPRKNKKKHLKSKKSSKKMRFKKKR